MTHSRSARAAAVRWRSPTTPTPRPTRRAPRCPTRARSSRAPASKIGSRRPTCSSSASDRASTSRLARPGQRVASAVGACEIPRTLVIPVKSHVAVELASPWRRSKEQNSRAAPCRTAPRQDTQRRKGGVMQIKPPARYQRIGWRRDGFRLNEPVTGALTFRIRLVERPASSGRRARQLRAGALAPRRRLLQGSGVPLAHRSDPLRDDALRARGRCGRSRASHCNGRVHCFGAAAALRVSTDGVRGSLSQPGCHSRGCCLVLGDAGNPRSRS